MKTNSYIFVFVLVLSYIAMVPIGGIQNRIDNERIMYNGHLYQLIPIFTTWLEAKNSCEARGGHLITINDESENDFVHHLAGWNAIWIGFTDERTEGDWQWITDEDVNYVNWISGEPNDSGNGEDYAEMLSDGYWNDVPDDNVERKCYVCEWDDADGRVTFNRHDYQVITIFKTWIEAKLDCEARGGHLVTITSNIENDFVRNLIEPETVWIGLTDATTEGDWQWITGEDVNYTNWVLGEPNDSGDGEHYAEMFSDGLWNDASTEINYYICEWGGSDNESSFFSSIFLLLRVFLFIVILMILFMLLRRNR